MKNNSIFKLIHDLLLKFQRKRRFVALSHGVKGDEAGEGLSYPEEAILLLLEARGEMNIRDLAENVKLERSWMSRVTSSLEERKLVKAFVPESDKRSKHLNITESGLQTLKRLDAIVYNIMNESLAVLNEASQKELNLYLHKLADSIGAEKIEKSKNSHPIDVALARISRVSGVVGENILESGLSVTKLQVLFTLYESDRELSIIQIAEILPFDFSTISRVISEFRRSKLVTKKQSQSDKRMYVVELSKNGIKKMEEYYRMLDSITPSVRSQFKDSELQRLIDLLKQLTSQEIRIRQFGKSDLELRKIDSIPGGLRQLEVHHGEKYTYGLYQDNTLTGYVQFQKEKGSKSFENFELKAGNIELKKLADFFNKFSRD